MGWWKKLNQTINRVRRKTSKIIIRGKTKEINLIERR